MSDYYPFVILIIGMATVIGMIIGLRINAFVALITAALVVSLLAPGETAGKIARVAAAFGKTAGGIGIVIAMAAIIGKSLMDSGAADRIVRSFLKVLGEKRSGTALAASGFVLSIPVFFDTVFYLLVPLARSLFRRTGKHYLRYVMAIAAGAAVTHTLVPPTPGPLLMAENLGVDIGVMILIGALVALPATAIGLLYGTWLDRRMPVEMRPLTVTHGPDPEADEAVAESEKELPGLLVSALPIILPIILIASNTAVGYRADAEHAAHFTTGQIADWQALRSSLASGQTISLEALPEGSRSVLAKPGSLSDSEKTILIDGLNTALGNKKLYPQARDLSRDSLASVEHANRLVIEKAIPESVLQRHLWETDKRKAANIGLLFGDPNFALLLSAAIAVLVYVRQRRPSKEHFAASLEEALMSGGLIILITAAGGAFGAMLQYAELGPAIERLFQGSSGAGLILLLLGFGIAALLKVAQGSSTVAMITASAMLAAMIDPSTLAFHPVYLATAVGGGSLMGSWMNDSGFWIFSKMSGLTEIESLKSWTPLLLILGTVTLVVTLILSIVLPMAG
jgi:H+/gluconate symporter-like permease